MFNSKLLAQPIVINKNYDKNSIIESTALASYFSIINTMGKHSDQENLKTWFNNDYRKTVRSFSPIKAINNYGFIGFPFNSNDPVAASTLPMKYEDYPNKIRKARVSDWKELSLLSLPTINSSDYIIDFYVNNDLTMSTGKLSAQCAHAVFLFTKDKKIDMLPLNTRVKLHYVNVEYLLSVCSDWVVDNGLTEIPKGSITIGWK